MRTSLMYVVAALSAAMVPSIALERAEACSCVRPIGGAKTYFRNADAVVLAVPQKVTQKAGAPWRRLEVVWALKGKVGAGSTLGIDGRQGPCSATFKVGQLALVYVRKGRALLCAGNYALSVTIKDMPVLLRAAGAHQGKKVHAPGALLTVGLRRALKGHLHGRRSIPLSSQTLKPKGKLRIGKSTLFVTRHVPKHGVILRHALQVGPIAFVQGSYPREGVVFTLLLQTPKKSSKKVRGKLLYERIVERKAPLPRTHRNRAPRSQIPGERRIP